MGNIRGLSIVSAVKYIRQKHGEDGFNKVIEEVPEQYRKYLTEKCEAMQWYPMPALINLMRATDKVMGQSDYKECEEIGKFSAEVAFGGLYKMFLEMGKPHTIIRRAPLAWRLINETGEMEIEVMSENSTKAKVTDFEDNDKAHCHYLIGYFQQVLTLTGGKNVTVKELQCVLEGADCCEFEAKWD